MGSGKCAVFRISGLESSVPFLQGTGPGLSWEELRVTTQQGAPSPSSYNYQIVENCNLILLANFAWPWTGGHCGSGHTGLPPAPDYGHLHRLASLPIIPGDLEQL